jgi:hypothetical protein
MPTYDVTLKRFSSGAVWEAIYPKTRAENIISGTFHVDRIPLLDAAKIGSGAFHVDRIPLLDAAKIGSGAFHVDRIPLLDAAKINSGTINAARLPAIALTNIFTATTLAVFITNVYSLDITGVQIGDIVICTTENKTYVHNGGSAGTSADFSALATPTDLVTSVAGKTGVVTLVKADVGLGNVDNTSDANKPVSTAQATAIELKVTANTAITAGTKAKITYDAKGLVTGGADLLPADIPVLDAAKITTGTFVDARIPSLAISKITNLQATLDAKQQMMPLTTEALLSGISGSEGMIALVQA